MYIYICVYIYIYIYIYICMYIYIYIFGCYTMGTNGLPDIYTRGLRVYISGKPQVHMVQLLCTTSVHYRAWASTKQPKPLL